MELGLSQTQLLPTTLWQLQTRHLIQMQMRPIRHRLTHRLMLQFHLTSPTKVTLQLHLWLQLRMQQRPFLKKAKCYHYHNWDHRLKMIHQLIPLHQPHIAPLQVGAVVLGSSQRKILQSHQESENTTLKENGSSQSTSGTPL